MKYESEILQTIHESAIERFKLGIVSEEKMREYDKLCLPSENSIVNKKQETVNIKHTNLATA